MGLFGKILKTTLDVATSPIAVVKDVATLGGAVNGRRQSYTSDKFDQLEDDWEDFLDEVDDL